MTFKKLCKLDYNSIIKSDSNKNNQIPEDKKNSDIGQLGKEIQETLKNRDWKQKFKRFASWLLGWVSNKAAAYDLGLKHLLKSFRQAYKDIDKGGNFTFVKDDQERASIDEKKKDEWHADFYLSERKKGTSLLLQGVPCWKTQTEEAVQYKFYWSEIFGVFEKYADAKKTVKNDLKILMDALSDAKDNKKPTDDLNKAIAILKSTLNTKQNAVWADYACRKSGVENNKLAEWIVNSDLPLARTYNVFDSASHFRDYLNKSGQDGHKEEDIKKAIINADVPFFPGESKLSAGEKIVASVNAYRLRYKKRECKDKEFAGQCLKNVNTYINKNDVDSSVTVAVVELANESIRKKLGKIGLTAFVIAAFILLATAVFNGFFKDEVKYNIGQTFEYQTEYTKYIYCKFDDSGVIILSADVDSAIGDYDVPTEIDGHNVVAIGEGAFKDCVYFDRVTIPNSVKSIGSKAFADGGNVTIYCEAQSKPDGWANDWHGGNTVMWGSGSAETVEIASGELRFALNDNEARLIGITNVEQENETLIIPKSVNYEVKSYPVTVIADNALRGAKIRSIVFEQDSEVKSIGEGAFADIRTLTSIVIPESVTTIGIGALEGCGSLVSLEIPFLGADSNGTKGYIGYLFGASGYAQNAAKTPVSLKTVVVNGGQIADNAFDGCAQIEEIILGDEVYSVGAGAFYGCNGLTQLTIPFVGQSSTDTSRAFLGYLFGASDYTQNSLVPDSLTALIVTGESDIAEHAFVGCDGLQEITINGGSSIGAGAFANCTDLESVTIKNALYIGDAAFKNCSALETLYIPDEIEGIGTGVFSGCDNLVYNEDLLGAKYIGSEKSKYLILVDGTKVRGSYTTNSDTRIIASDAFSQCSGLTQITITSGVMQIGRSAFLDCTSLASVTFADNGSLTDIAEYAFAGCTSLTSITIPDSVTSIGDYAFYGCTGLTEVTIGNGVTIIGKYVFSGCIQLLSIDIPDNVISIGCYAFYNCNSLHSVTISDSMTTIEDGTFYNCASLQSITISDSVKSIGNIAFAFCSGLTSITIPIGIVKLGNYSFYECVNLTSVTIPDSVTSIGDCAFEGCTNIESATIPTLAIASIPQSSLVTVVLTGGESIPASAFRDCVSLTSITICDSVTAIGQGAFYGCSALNAIILPEAVTSIGKEAFYACSGLTSVSLNNSLTTIGETSFYNCSGLISITIPDNVTSIGERAFYNCGGLISITIGKGVTSIDGYAFYGCHKLIEVYNKSNLNIVAGSSANGYVARYAIKVLTKEDDSRLTVDDKGFVFYYNGTTGYLVGYAGCEKALVLPDGFTAYDGTTVDSYEIYTYAFYNRGDLISITIPSSVTNIGGYTFWGCTNLTSIIISDSVISIGFAAFSDCNSLISIMVGSNNPKYHSAGNCIIETATKTLIAGCKASIIPDNGSVTNIDGYAFYCCSGLTSITIPRSIKNIGSSAFAGCSDLTSITIHDGVTMIENSAFSGCTGLTSITIPESVTTIKNGTFYGCSDLISITIPDSVASIGDSAFSGCSGLTSITIPDSVTSIGSETFYGCDGLTSVIIGGSVTSIGSNAFWACYRLVEVYNKSKLNIVVGGYDNGYIARYAKNVYKEEGGSRLAVDGDGFVYYYAGKTGYLVGYTGREKELVLPDGFVAYNGARVNTYEINEYAFYDCNGLTTITIPDSVTNIGRFAFYGCSGLTSVTFENTSGWQVSTSSSFDSYTSLSSSSLSNTSTAASYLKSTYYNYYWRRV